MAKPAKERINRSAAFEEAKDDISKWTGVVKRNREAEHLSFPMNAPQAPAHSNASLTVKFKVCA
jgi:U3 small nucleolar RNA-associated protein 14